MSTLTLYTWPKPFTHPHIATIQRNGIRSWLKLQPRPAVVVFGQEPGVAEICKEMDLIHCTEPLEVIADAVTIQQMAAYAEAVTDSPALGLVNTDIILTQSLMDALEAVSMRYRKFFLGASAWNLSVTEPMKFEPGWEKDLRRRVALTKELRGRVSSDFMIFPRGFLNDAPRFLVGRYYIDNGLMWFTRTKQAALVDGTTGILNVHQAHDYQHLGKCATVHSETPGAKWNIQCIGGRRNLYSWTNATDLYTERGLQPYWAGRLTRWGAHPDTSIDLQIFNKVLALCSRPLRKVLGMVNPRL